MTSDKRCRKLVCDLVEWCRVGCKFSLCGTYDDIAVCGLDIFDLRRQWSVVNSGYITKTYRFFTEKVDLDKVSYGGSELVFFKWLGEEIKAIGIVNGSGSLLWQPPLDIRL